MSLQKIFDTAAEGMRAVLTNAGQPQVKYLLGEEHLDLGEEVMSENQTAVSPSVVWVPIGGAVEQWGSMRDKTSVRTARSIPDPQQIARINAQIDAYCWESDLPRAEALLNRVWATLRLQLTAYSFKPVSVRWALAKGRRGVYAILGFTLGIPVTYEPDQIAHAPLTTTVEGEFVAEVS